MATFRTKNVHSAYIVIAPCSLLVTQTWLLYICERQKQQRHLSRGFRRWIQTFLATVNQTWATPPSFEHVLSQKVGKKLRYLELIKSILYQSIRTRVHWGFPVLLVRERGFRLPNNLYELILKGHIFLQISLLNTNLKIQLLIQYKWVFKWAF